MFQTSQRRAERTLIAHMERGEGKRHIIIQKVIYYPGLLFDSVDRYLYHGKQELVYNSFDLLFRLLSILDLSPNVN